MRKLRGDYNCAWASDLALSSGQPGDPPSAVERVLNMDWNSAYIKNY